MEIDTAVIAAIVSGIVAIMTAAITSIVSFSLQKDRLHTELKLEFATEAALRDLLSHEQWKLRSFEVIRRRFKGIDADELRRSLIRAGALSFEGKEGEVWGLRERNKDKLASAG